MRIKALFLVALMASSLCSCGKIDASSSFPDGSLSRVSDQKIADAVFHFSFDYELFMPGSSPSYYMLWTGYDLENKFGPSVPLTDRFYTYLTTYQPKSGSYYALYLTSKTIEEAKAWYDGRKSRINPDDPNYHFCDDFDVLDGKVLAYAQTQETVDYRVYSTKDPSSLPFFLPGYQLAVCLEEKPLTIEKNVSLDQEVNRTIPIYRRSEWAYSPEEGVLKPYVFSGDEGRNVKVVDSRFSYEGSKIEAYPFSFQSADYSYCPLLGLGAFPHFSSAISARVREEGILLPRYSGYGPSRVDLLNPSTDFTAREDVYRDFKSRFQEAYLRDSDETFGYFDTDKVMNIIHQVGRGI